MDSALIPEHKSLVLVLGAGASKEVKLPVGEELKKTIALSLGFQVEMNEVVGGDRRIVEAFYQLAQQSGAPRDDYNRYLAAAAQIRDAMPLAQSIDNFIDSHRLDTYIAQRGKLAIVSCILKAERASSLWFDHNNIYNTIKFSKVEDTWFSGLFQLIAQSCQSMRYPIDSEKSP